MARQNALRPQITTLPTDATGMVQPVDVTLMIPTAKQAKESRTGRDRKWEKKNPASSYRIPPDLHIQAKDIRSFILERANDKMTSASMIANAMMVYALAHVRDGSLTIEARPKPERRKMALVLTEVNEWPREKTAKIKAAPKIKAEAPSLVITYRWSRDVNTQIKALAGDAISEGEIVVFLLNFALQGYNSGKLQFKEETTRANQIVGATW
ncbi:MAG: hypothetical protein HYR70_04175 [Chloroflexi bacterium]|nr:hypothetical protein [Chloroflexota bacterium]MBI3340753.1 hypothetical protein [Chloroflexota bacterium]